MAHRLAGWFFNLLADVFDYLSLLYYAFVLFQTQEISYLSFLLIGAIMIFRILGRIFEILAFKKVR